MPDTIDNTVDPHNGFIASAHNAFLDGISY